MPGDSVLSRTLAPTRARIAACVVVVAILLASRLLAPAAAPPRTLLEKTVSWGSLLWLGALLPGSLGLIGTLLYQFPTDLDDASWELLTGSGGADSSAAAAGP